MPRITHNTIEEWYNFYGGLSPVSAKRSAVNADSSTSASGANKPVHGLFYRVLAVLGLVMLWCGLSLGAHALEKHVEVSANGAIVAVSRGIGHLAHAVAPFADARLLVFRQLGYSG